MSASNSSKLQTNFSTYGRRTAVIIQQTGPQRGRGPLLLAFYRCYASPSDFAWMWNLLMISSPEARQQPADGTCGQRQQLIQAEEEEQDSLPGPAVCLRWWICCMSEANEVLMNGWWAAAALRLCDSLALSSWTECLCAGNKWKTVASAFCHVVQLLSDVAPIPNPTHMFQSS